MIFWEDDETGEEDVVVEGFPSNRPLTKDKSSLGWGNLKNEKNEKEQTKPEIVKLRDPLPIPEDMTPDEFEKALEDAADTYDGSTPYKPLPKDGDESGNSNSLAGSVIREFDNDYEPSRNVRGWNKDVLPPPPPEKPLVQ